MEGCSEVSIQNMIEFLSHPQFDLKTAENIELLSRFIIEDNYEDKISYDIHATCPINMVRSIIRNVIGVYEIFDDKKEAQLRENIIKLFTKNEKRL